MAAPIGTWDININGFWGLLSIQAIDPQGNLGRSSVVSDHSDPIIGFWDEVSQKITFMRLINQNDSSTFQIFTGYLIVTQADGSLALAGSFEAFQGTGATAQRVIYGWYATPQVIQ